MSIFEILHIQEKWEVIYLKSSTYAVFFNYVTVFCTSEEQSWKPIYLLYHGDCYFIVS